MENDYQTKNHKDYVDSILQKNDFVLVYNENYYDLKNFYQVWKKLN